MNITTQIFPLKNQQSTNLFNKVVKYAPHALQLYLRKNQLQLKSLTKSQKIIVSKIFRNLNILCKLTKKELKELFKQSKQFTLYQQVMGELYFDQKINNYILINKQEANVKIESQMLKKSSTEQGTYYKPSRCIGVYYKLEFTISNINKKRVMKPIILLIFKMENSSEIKLYYSLEEFNELRFEVAENIKKVYGIQLRTMF